MKYRYLLFTAIAGLALASFTSCKTNEANYKTAYEAAKQKQQEDSGVEETVFRQMHKESFSSYLIDGNDSIPVRTVNVRLTTGCEPQTEVGKYGIAVAGFKQLFNARSMMTRLRENGYPDATVVENSEPTYYVLAATSDSADVIAEKFNKLKNDKSISLREQYPWILSPSIYPYRR